MQTKSILLDAAAMDRALIRVAHQILEQFPEHEKDICLVGIKTRGLPLAQQLAGNIARISGYRPEVGALNISLYRDDLSEVSDMPRTGALQLPFSPKGRIVVLCDDVIFTGRTARAAMDALIREGRPKRIALFALIDRGHRELPIRPDFVGKNVPTSRSEAIQVCLPQTDAEQCVKLVSL